MSGGAQSRNPRPEGLSGRLGWRIPRRMAVGSVHFRGEAWRFQAPGFFAESAATAPKSIKF
jgi:hypothetical protein